MSGPWYETVGPNANDVRNDILIKMKSQNFREKITDKELETILLKNIPDTHKDFGSWRGYATFGLDKSYMDNIKLDIQFKINKEIKK